MKHGLQSVCQGSVAFGKLVHRLLFASHETDEPEEIVVWLVSDSSLQLVQSMDVPRRFRHVEIRLQWLRERMRDGLLKLKQEWDRQSCRLVHKVFEFQIVLPS